MKFNWKLNCKFTSSKSIPSRLNPLNSLIQFCSLVNKFLSKEIPKMNGEASRERFKQAVKKWNEKKHRVLKFIIQVLSETIKLRISSLHFFSSRLSSNIIENRGNRQHRHKLVQKGEQRQNNPNQWFATSSLKPPTIKEKQMRKGQQKEQMKMMMQTKPTRRRNQQLIRMGPCRN